MIASVTASILQPVGGQIAQVIHYTHDPVSLFHYDNDGITSIKWFYFPFEPSSNDSGFLYASGSQRVTDIRSKMLSHMNKSYLDAVPVSNMRPEELDSIYPIHSFNKANSLVIANTAGFHARATVPSEFNESPSREVPTIHVRSILSNFNVNNPFETKSYNLNFIVYFYFYCSACITFSHDWSSPYFSFFI